MTEIESNEESVVPCDVLGIWASDCHQFDSWASRGEDIAELGWVRGWSGLEGWTGMNEWMEERLGLRSVLVEGRR